MPRIVRLPNAKVTWTILAVLVLLVTLIAAGLLPGGFIVASILILPVIYAGYLWALCFCIEGQVVAVEGTRLVKRAPDHRQLAELDLSAPFEAECLFHGSTLALFKVTQAHRSFRFLAEVKEAEHLAREVLQMPWSREPRALWWV
jgi:hypothetical protein